MKNTLAFALAAIAFLSGSEVFAVQPPDLGHYKGLAFSSATDRQPLEIIGGNLVKCTTDPSARLRMSHCEVEKGSLVVTGTDSNALNIKLTNVSAYRSRGENPAWIYYLVGTTDIKIGDQVVNAEVGATLSVEDAFHTRIRGVVSLAGQDAKSSLEAYLVP